jgi:phage terminase small subunit
MSNHPQPEKKLVAPRRNKISEKEKVFVSTYLGNGYNGTQAAVAAGYKGRSARTIAARMLAKDNIRALVDSKVNKIVEEQEVTFAWKLGLLKDTALAAHSEGKYNAVAANVSVMNKMQGHDAPVKHINANINIEVEQKHLYDMVDGYAKDF